MLSKEEYYKWSIDFDRINELSAPHSSRDALSSNMREVSPITRSIVKDYIRYWNQFILEGRSTVNDEKMAKMEYIINVLRDNRILLSPADIRDKKIDSII